MVVKEQFSLNQIWERGFTKYLIPRYSLWKQHDTSYLFIYDPVLLFSQENADVILIASMLLGFVAQRFDCVIKLTPKYTQRPIRRAKSAIRSRWEIGNVMTRRQPEGRKNASYQVTIDCIFVSDWSKRCTWWAFLRLIAEQTITKSTQSQIDLDTQQIFETNYS